MSGSPARDAGASPERYDLVAVGSSAGGVGALLWLMSSLPSDLAVPMLIVQHLDRSRKTTLAEVLGRRSKMPIKIAEAGEQIKPGVAYVAPPDMHLRVTPGGFLTLTSSELVHFVRPSADLLFESVARCYGERAIVCVLTGTGVDGAAGVAEVGAHGGKVIVEDPDTAEFDGMPQAAAGTGAADIIVPLDQIADTIEDLIRIGR